MRKLTAGIISALAIVTLLTAPSQETRPTPTWDPYCLFFPANCWW